MREEKLNAQIPILRFLNKHKWRIVFSILFCVIYFGIPRVINPMIASQYYLFITSAENASAAQLNDEVVEISNQALSDASLRGLIVKYDFFADERKKGVAEETLIEKMRRRTKIEPEVQNTADGAMVFIWAHTWDEDPQKVTAVTDEIASRFEAQTNLRVMKYIPPQYDYQISPIRAFVLAVMQGTALSLLLILIWEIPSMFYSQKTKEQVFNPLKSDWQNELLDAKLKKQRWKAVKINIRYSYAFLATMLQKSPIGDLIEFGRKFAK